MLDILAQNGYRNSRVSVLSHLGGADEARSCFTPGDAVGDVAGLSSFAIECVPDYKAVPMARGHVLSDESFIHDGQLTKQSVRAVTLAHLAPQDGQLLWDIGCGCGSIAIEWLRNCDYGSAIGIEPNADRRAKAAQNAQNLGVPELQLVDASAPDGLVDLPQPDAIFIGGGLSEALAQYCFDRLGPMGRLVSNAVTLQSEVVLHALYTRLGGNLERIEIAKASAIGTMEAWRPSMPITQWSIVKS